MKAHGMLSVDALQSIPIEELEKIIRPSGFYIVKSARLKKL